MLDSLLCELNMCYNEIRAMLAFAENSKFSEHVSKCLAYLYAYTNRQSSAMEN